MVGPEDRSGDPWWDDDILAPGSWRAADLLMEPDPAGPCPLTDEEWAARLEALCAELDTDPPSAEVVAAGGEDGLRDSLVERGVPTQLVGHLLSVLPGLIRAGGAPRGTSAMAGVPEFDDADTALGIVESAALLSSVMDAGWLLAARDLAIRAGQDLLAEKGLRAEVDLTPSAREKWSGSCRRLASVELATLTGVGRGRMREMVAFAFGPDEVVHPTHLGLQTGVARWELVAAFWRRCRRNERLPGEAAGEIAEALFGMDPELVCVERRTPTGDVSRRPWQAKEFYVALEREVVLRESRDPEAAEAERAAKHAARTAYGIVDDDGTGQVVITGQAAWALACMDRLNGLARKARNEGDPRTEAQIRSDLARGLLLYGVLDLPDLGDEPDLVTPDQIQELVQVVAGAPRYELQVVVPWDALAGHALVPAPNPPPDLGAGPAQPEPGRDPRGEPGAWRPQGVGRVLGRYPVFLTRTEIQRIAGGPGVTLARLLVDPADGRCIERTRNPYVPDAAMRAQIRAADVTSRFPGSTGLVKEGDLDHVVPYLLGGPTSATNLQGIERNPAHALKTEGFWRAEMDRSRNVTWTSYFGRTYTTRPHDYLQYLETRTAITGHEGAGSADAQRPRAGRGTGGRDGEPRQSWRDVIHDPVERARYQLEERHLASLLVYAALTARRAGAPLYRVDDDPAADELIDDAHQTIWVRHTAEDGRRVDGPREGTPTPEQIIATDPQEILDARHWTDVFTEAAQDETPAGPGVGGAEGRPGCEGHPGPDRDDDPTDPIPF